MYNDTPAPGERTRRTFCAVCKHHYNARIAAQTAAVPVACAHVQIPPRWERRRQNAPPVTTTGTSDSARATVAAELGQQPGLYVACRSRQTSTSMMRAMLSKILLSDEKQAEPVKCEGRVVSSASERRQRDRTVVFEGKWAYMRYQGKTLHLGTVMRIQHELTERSSNLRHGLLGGHILACYSMSASTSERQIVSSATAKVLWTGQKHVFFGPNRRHKM
jgi:hypothetical protein